MFKRYNPNNPDTYFYNPDIFNPIYELKIKQILFIKN